MTIYRNASINDVSILQNLNNEVFVDNAKYDNDLVVNWALTDKGQKYFSEILEKPNVCCLIAEDNKKPIGYIAAVPKEMSYRKSKWFEIENMGVIPEYRSKGIGSELIKRCLEWAIEKGFQKMYVNAYFQNTRAVDFYKRNGFKETDLSLERKI